MSSPALFGISVAAGLVAWGAVTRQYLWPWLKERPGAESFKPVLLLHGFRFLGLSLAIPGVVSADLPAAFSRPAAYGDFTAAVLAWLALATLGTRTGTLLTWVFNVFGTADLLFAFYEGSRVSLPETPGLLGAAWFILAAFVPILLITHGLTFRLLLRTEAVAPARSKSSGVNRRPFSSAPVRAE